MLAQSLTCGTDGSGSTEANPALINASSAAITYTKVKSSQVVALAPLYGALAHRLKKLKRTSQGNRHKSSHGGNAAKQYVLTAAFQVWSVPSGPTILAKPPGPPAAPTIQNTLSSSSPVFLASRPYPGPTCSKLLMYYGSSSSRTYSPWPKGLAWCCVSYLFQVGFLFVHPPWRQRFRVRTRICWEWCIRRHGLVLAFRLLWNVHKL